MARPDRLVALFLLCFSAGYGYLTITYSLLPFERFIAFRPDTMPTGLAALGIFFSLAVIASPGGNDTGISKDAEGWHGFEWKLFFLMLVLLIAYTVTLRPFGYLFSTVMFLVLGGYLLGERKYIVLISVSVIGTAFTWFLVDTVLGIYLKPLPAFMG